MRTGSFVLVAFLMLTGCGPNIETSHWVSQPSEKSPYKATVTGKTYNWGESQTFSIRIDAVPVGRDSGWFLSDDIDSGGLVRAVKPTLVWRTPTDLLVLVHTQSLSGETVRRFGEGQRPAGSLTLRYIANQR